MTDFDKLVKMTDLIPSEDIREYTKDFLLTKTPAYFKEIAASSSGKFHPKFASGHEGLVRHIMAAVYFASEIVKLEYFHFSQRTKSKILAAVFLHDAKKRGEVDSGATDLMDHAKAAADMIEDKDISLYVLSHMGQWGVNKPGTIEAFVVHLADYLASRKPIDINFAEMGITFE